MKHKRLLNNNKIFVEQKNNSIYKWRSRKWCNETWYEKSILYLHYLTSTKSFTLSYLLSSKLQDFPYHINRHSKGLFSHNSPFWIFEFLVVKEKNIFAYKPFLTSNTSDFDLFFMWKLQLSSWKKSSPISQQFTSKSWGPVKPPILQNLVGGSMPAPWK